MAASITPISIAAPAELVAARPAKTVSSAAIKKDGFQSELNSAAQKERASNQQAETSKKQQSSDVKADKADLNGAKDHSSSTAEENKSNSSLNARDTNEVSAQQRKELNDSSSNSQNLTKENKIVADSSVEQDVQQTTDTGKSLPLNGETLPQPVANGKEVVVPEQVIEPPFDKTALDLEISKLHNQVLSNQPESALTTQVAAALQTDSAASNSTNTNTNIAQEPVAPQNKQLLETELLTQQSVRENIQASVRDKTATPTPIAPSVQEPINTIQKTVANANIENITSKLASVSESLAQPGLTKNDTNITPVTNVSEVVSPVSKKAGIALDTTNTNGVLKADVAETVKDLGKINTAEQVAQKSESISIAPQPTVAGSETLNTNPRPVDSQANTASISPLETAKNVLQETASAKDIQVSEVINADKPAFNNNQVNIKEQPKAEIVNTVQPTTDKVTSEVQNTIPVASNPTKTELEPKVSQLQAIAASVDSKANANKQTGGNSASSQASVVDFAPQAQASVNTNSNQQGLAIQGAVVSSTAGSNEQTQSASLNQTLDKLRAGIDITDSKGAQEASDSKPTSVKASANVESLQQLSNFQNSLRSTSPVQMQMPVGTPPGAKNWGRAVADKVFIAASQNLRVANIQLDPPELGALQIRLQVTGPDQQMSVAFSSPHASVRDVLEQQIPRLKEMLAEQGINLGESSVNDQGGDNKQGTAKSGGNRGGNYADGSDLDSPANPLNTQGTLSLVDFYA
jgi:flagellar hook-length control protein FliK